jgi:hypothetical protein
MAEDVRRVMNEILLGIEPLGLEGIVRRLIQGTKLTSVLKRLGIEDEVTSDIGSIFDKIGGKEWNFGKGIEMDVALEVTGVKTHETKKSGKEMAFLEVSDSKGNTWEMLIFPSTWDDCDGIEFQDSVIVCKVGWLKDLRNYAPNNLGKLALADRPYKVAR